MRTRVIECAAVDSLPSGDSTKVNVVLSPDGATALDLTLGPREEFDIAFLTNPRGVTVQIIRSGEPPRQTQIAARNI
jgi:hypothetical protein